MPGRYIKKRKQTWFSNIPIPSRYRHLHGGRSKIEVSLKTRDERIAERTARSMAARLQLQWAAKVDGCKQSEAALRLTTYEQAREAALTGRIVADVREGLAPLDPDRVYEAVELITDEVRDAALYRTDPDENPEGDVELTPLEQARLDGLWDGVRELRGETPDSRAAYEPSFRDVAGRWMDEWKARPGRKDANTSRQYESTIRMFSQWWGEKMEHLEIAPNIWARIIGHEPGFTFGTYNPIGLTLAKKAEVIGRLSYAGLNLPPPGEVYGERAAAPKVRSRTCAGRAWTSSRTASGCRPRSWRRSSRTRTTRCGWCSSAPCGSPASTFPRSAPSISTSR